VKLDSVRELKQSLLAAPEFRRRGPFRAGPSPIVYASFTPEGPARGQPLPVALGIAGNARAYRLAVRVQAPFPGIGAWLERVRTLAKDEVDLRVVGRIFRQATRVTARAPVARRTRPLVAGISIGHYRITAGTLGAFVGPARGDAGARYLLSNNHVLAREDLARKGEAVLQPGAADGGRNPGDLVARFERAVRLKAAKNHVDAALARVEDGVAITAGTLPGLGRLAGVRTAALAPGLRAAKVGRTTGRTRGIVSAIEVDRVVVGYDRGDLVFDDQIEIVPAGTGAFSRGGDSGSVVVDAERRAIGLLFAGNDVDTTYVNPIAPVLAGLRVRLDLGKGAGPVRAARPRAGASPRYARAKRRAAEAFGAHGRVVGVGVTRQDGRPALKVNFEKKPKRAKQMPRTIDGLPVVVAVVGDIKKQEA
jgi:hypothetical protein